MDVWVKVEQRVPGHVPLRPQTVQVNNVRQRQGQQILLGVGIYCMDVGLCRETTQREKSKKQQRTRNKHHFSRHRSDDWRRLQHREERKNPHVMVVCFHSVSSMLTTLCPPHTPPTFTTVRQSRSKGACVGHTQREYIICDGTALPQPDCPSGPVWLLSKKKKSTWFVSSHNVKERIALP